MKLKKLSRREWAMVVAVVLLAIMIATRWQYLGTRVGGAFRKRFQTEKQNEAFPQEKPHSDSLSMLTRPAALR